MDFFLLVWFRNILSCFQVTWWWNPASSWPPQRFFIVFAWFSWAVRVSGGIARACTFAYVRLDVLRPAGLAPGPQKRPGASSHEAAIIYRLHRRRRHRRRLKKWQFPSLSAGVRTSATRGPPGDTSLKSIKRTRLAYPRMGFFIPFFSPRTFRIKSQLSRIRSAPASEPWGPTIACHWIAA